MVECWDAVREGFLAEERREKMRRTGRTRGSGLGDYISTFIRREVNMAWGPVDLEVKYVMLIVSMELFG